MSSRSRPSLNTAKLWLLTDDGFEQNRPDFLAQNHHFESEVVMASEGPRVRIANRFKKYLKVTQGSDLWLLLLFLSFFPAYLPVMYAPILIAFGDIRDT